MERNLTICRISRKIGLSDKSTFVAFLPYSLPLNIFTNTRHNSKSQNAHSDSQSWRNMPNPNRDTI